MAKCRGNQAIGHRTERERTRAKSGRVLIVGQAISRFIKKRARTNNRPASERGQMVNACADLFAQLHELCIRIGFEFESSPNEVYQIEAQSLLQTFGEFSTRRRRRRGKERRHEMRHEQRAGKVSPIGFDGWITEESDPTLKCSAAELRFGFSLTPFVLSRCCNDLFLLSCFGRISRENLTTREPKRCGHFGGNGCRVRYEILAVSTWPNSDLQLSLSGQVRYDSVRLERSNERDRSKRMQK